MRKTFFFVASIFLVVLSTGNISQAQQQYKLRQSTSMMGMNSESTIYVKGMRKRTEPGSMMGMMTQPVTIEQCDLQRTIKINDKKKLYFIEPFAKEEEEIIDEDVKPVTPAKNKPVVTKTNPQTGGIVYMYYNIRDTGERKNMSGFVARHIWTTQKIKPEPNACSMKDSIIIKTDGWYIDLPQFNCPVKYRPAKSMMPPAPQQTQKPDCQDKFVTKRSGKGKLGFPLTETKTIIMGGQENEFTTTTETLEFSTLKLDSMLFEIPPGYQEAKSESELEEKMDMKSIMDGYKNMDADQIDISKMITNEQKAPGKIRIGVYKPKGDEEMNAAALQKHMTLVLMAGNVEAVSVETEEEAKQLNCDYTLGSEFISVKQVNKVGGLLKAIKNTNPAGSQTFNISVEQILIKLSDNSIRLQPKINGKYEGNIDMAAEKALDEGCYKVLKELK